MNLGSFVLAQSNDSNGSALFALLGVLITSAIALIAVLLKFLFDVRLERVRYERQLEANALEHGRSMDRLRLELSERRFNSLTSQQVEAIAKFLAASLGVFRQVVRAHASWNRTRDETEYLAALRAVDATEGQITFEELRLVAMDDVVERATKLWNHLRGEKVPQGHLLEPADWESWRKKYWAIRKDLIEDVRSALVAYSQGHGDPSGP